MTPAEADQRIMKSRQTLAQYEAMVASGLLPVADLGLMHDEIELLEKLAGMFPEKLEKLEALAHKWIALLDRIRPKLN